MASPLEILSWNILLLVKSFMFVMLLWFLGMNDSPEVVFGEWAKKYGDIFGFKVGERWMVVLNRQALIKEAVLKQGVDFAGRPDFYSRKWIGFSNQISTQYFMSWLGLFLFNKVIVFVMSRYWNYLCNIFSSLTSFHIRLDKH